MTSHTNSLQVRLAKTSLFCFPLTLFKSVFSLFKKPNKSKGTMLLSEFPSELPCPKDSLSPVCAHGRDICITHFLTHKACLFCLVYLQSRFFSWFFDLWSQGVLEYFFFFMIWTLSASISRWGPVCLSVRASVPISAPWAAGLQEQHISAGLLLRRMINPV